MEIWNIYIILVKLLYNVIGKGKMLIDIINYIVNCYFLVNCEWRVSVNWE